MRSLLFVFILGMLYGETIIAQEEAGFLKEYVRSFNLRQSDTVLIDLQIPYELIDWDEDIVRTFTQLESFSMPKDILRKLFRRGRYSMYGNRKDKVLRIFMPDVHHAIMVQGYQLTDEVVAQIYVPKNFPVKVVCNSRTAAEQLMDLWLQQEVLTRRMKFPIRRAINADFYDDVKFQEGKIVAASPMKGTKRFLNLKVKANGKEYQVVSRIGKLYEDPSDLLDKVVVFVEHNLAPELRKSTNQGMVIVQENAKGALELIDKSAIPDFLLVTK